LIAGARYVHTNLVARDWRRLAAFYQTLFGCVPALPERDYSGPIFDAGTGIKGARLTGVHLRMPGAVPDGPTLEIFSYDELVERGMPTANRCGFAHLAFAVDDVDQALEAVIAAGGGAVGRVATTDVGGVGLLRVVYARDPEGNIVELQKWS